VAGRAAPLPRDRGAAGRVIPVHQALAAAAPHDAVTDQALRVQGLLRGWGHPSEVVAGHVHPRLAGRVQRLDRGGRERLREGAVLLHYSIWSEAVEAALESGAPLAMAYHNVTPGDLLRAANPAVAAACDAGRARLPELRGRVRVLIAYSSFNALDVRAAGLGESVVLPLLLDAAPAAPAPGPAPAGPPVVLTVGRIAPNKRIEDVMRVTALLQRAHDPEASLVVVGAADSFEGYRAALDDLGRRIGLRNASFRGRVPDEALARAYAGAHAYLVMSVHEGFCVPVVEAMQHGLPVVARAAAAVPETLGGAGLALDDDDLAVFAEAVWEVSRPGPVRAGLQQAMRARLAELAPERTAARLRTALAPLLEAA